MNVDEDKEIGIINNFARFFIFKEKLKFQIKITIKYEYNIQQKKWTGKKAWLTNSEELFSLNYINSVIFKTKRKLWYWITFNQNGF